MLRFILRDAEGKKNIMDPRVREGLSEVEIVHTPSTLIVHTTRGGCVITISDHVTSSILVREEE